MSFDQETDDPEPVNLLDYLTAFGIQGSEAYNIIIHMLLTRTYVFPDEARKAAAELGIVIPYVHPGDGRMH